MYINKNCESVAVSYLHSTFMLSNIYFTSSQIVPIRFFIHVGYDNLDDVHPTEVMEVDERRKREGRTDSRQATIAPDGSQAPTIYYPIVLYIEGPCSSDHPGYLG